MEHPARILLDDTDPRARARAHTRLGERAIAREDWPTAEAHLREALELDPTDREARRLLSAIVKPEAAPVGWRGGIGSWLRWRS